ncbi:hypothetical protein NDU88_008342, partial [Pleurodeles waltl]
MSLGGFCAAQRGGQCHRLVSVQRREEDSVTGWFLCSAERRTVSSASFCAAQRGGQCHQLVFVQHREEDSVTGWFLCRGKDSVTGWFLCSAEKDSVTGWFLSSADKRTVSLAGFCAAQRGGHRHRLVSVQHREDSVTG